MRPMTSRRSRPAPRSGGGHLARGLARLPKLCGADIELGNFIIGPGGDGDTAPLASRTLLREVAGVASERGDRFGSRYASAWGVPYAVPQYAWWNPQDVGRKFLASTAGCIYIDLDHFEVCVPETISAYDHVAAWHAMLRIARRALTAANETLPSGGRIQVLVNNSDGHSNSYGSHTNFLISRQAWENIFHRKIQYQLFLAAYQASSILFTGQGKVGAENGAPPVAFQLSQRADFFETLSGVQTTYRRPLVNSRDESLCGAGDNGLARLHCIFFDNTLCHVATLLKIGVTQIVLAMIESECVDPRLILDDALIAVRRWSHDPTLQARAPLMSGEETTAVELQQRFLDRAERFAAAGGCDGVVPRAGEILQLWADTLAKLAAGDWGGLCGRLDWVLKAHLLRRALQRRPDLHWGSPALKHLDLLYSSLDLSEGLYWTCERDGVVERVVDDERIAHFVDNPPEDTRAWTRAMLLRLGEREAVRIDWDSMTFEIADASGIRRRMVLDLADPLGFTRPEFERRCGAARGVEEVLTALGAVDAERAARPTETALARTTH
jgi:Pup amidohydrolase